MRVSYPQSRRQQSIVSTAEERDNQSTRAPGSICVPRESMRETHVAFRQSQIDDRNKIPSTSFQPHLPRFMITVQNLIQTKCPITIPRHPQLTEALADSPRALYVGIASQPHTLAALIPHSDNPDADHSISNMKAVILASHSARPNTAALLVGQASWRIK